MSLESRLCTRFHRQPLSATESAHSQCYSPCADFRKSSSELLLNCSTFIRYDFVQGERSHAAVLLRATCPVATAFGASTKEVVSATSVHAVATAR